MQAYVAKVKSKTPIGDYVDFALELPTQSGFDFAPGQFVNFHIGSVLRSYSLASLPEQLPALRFLAKLEPQGVGSEFIRNLEVGDGVEIDGPHGHFYPKTVGKPLVFVVTGAGLAPCLSLIKHNIKLQKQAPITLLFGVRDESQALCFSELGELATKSPLFHFIPMLSQGSPNWSGVRGRVTEYLQNQWTEFGDKEFLVCGNQFMVLEARKLLLEKGVLKENIVLESFGTQDVG